MGVLPPSPLLADLLTDWPPPSPPRWRWLWCVIHASLFVFFSFADRSCGISVLQLESAAMNESEYDALNGHRGVLIVWLGSVLLKKLFVGMKDFDWWVKSSEAQWAWQWSIRTLLNYTLENKTPTQIILVVHIPKVYPIQLRKNTVLHFSSEQTISNHQRVCGNWLIRYLSPTAHFLFMFLKKSLCLCYQRTQLTLQTFDHVTFIRLCRSPPPRQGLHACIYFFFYYAPQKVPASEPWDAHFWNRLISGNNNLPPTSVRQAVPSTQKW